VRQRLTATPTLVKIYSDLFVNRRAYTLQPMRPRAESGRHYYYRPKQRDSGAPLLMTEQTDCGPLGRKDNDRSLRH
jgi:hypothetical protein